MRRTTLRRGRSFLTFQDVAVSGARALRVVVDATAADGVTARAQEGMPVPPVPLR
jgi:hypothetical protein